MELHEWERHSCWPFPPRPHYVQASHQRKAFGPVLARPLSPQAELGLRGLTLYAPHATERINELLGRVPKGGRSSPVPSAGKSRSKSSKAAKKRVKSKSRGNVDGDDAKPRKARSKSRRKSGKSKSPVSPFEVCESGRRWGVRSLALVPRWSRVPRSRTLKIVCRGLPWSF